MAYALRVNRLAVSKLLYAEGFLLLGLAAWLLVMGFTHENREFLPLLGVILFAVAGGLGLLQCGIGYALGKNYGKAPAILANLIALGVVKYQVEAGLYFIAIPLGILALITLLLVLKVASSESK